MVDHSIAVMAGGIAVNEALAAARADKKTRRDMLRVASCGFLSASALAWYAMAHTLIHTRKPPRALP